MGTWYAYVKRAFDLFCSALAIVVLFPLGLMIAIGIKLSSKGPVFYTTERIGKDGKPFKVYKFRSMHVYNPDESGKSDKEGTYFANTSRIFKFGKLLRASKLDELPQLINIFRAEMSIVGPRPVPLKTAQRNYSGENACILSVRPGLTCLDSLFDYAHGELFTDDIDTYRQKIVPVRNRLARMYVEKQSVGLDIYCIFRTVLLIVQIMVLKKKSFVYTRYEKQAEETVFGK